MLKTKQRRYLYYCSKPRMSLDLDQAGHIFNLGVYQTRISFALGDCPSEHDERGSQNESCGLPKCTGI